MSDIKSQSPHVSGYVPRVGVGRRHLLRAGLAITPIVLAVSGRSAMAAPCPSPLSPMILASLDPNGTGDCAASSHHVFTNSLGLSPATWKPIPVGQTFLAKYPWPIAPFTQVKTKGDKLSWDPLVYTSYKDIASENACWASGLRYNAIFTSSQESRSCSRVLLDSISSLEGHFCAAYFNAAAMPAGTYAMTVKEVLYLAATGCLVPGSNMLTAGQIKNFLSQTWA